jgi:hypothetical protein
MPNEWKIRKGDVEGGDSGQLLDGCEVRRKADGTGYELVAILAETNDSNLPVNFHPFAYRGLIWDMAIESFDHGPQGDQPIGPWGNNARKGLLGDETGTWTAQAGSGGMGEGDGEEDAASASA